MNVTVHVERERGGGRERGKEGEKEKEKESNEKKKGIGRGCLLLPQTSLSHSQSSLLWIDGQALIRTDRIGDSLTWDFS